MGNAKYVFLLRIIVNSNQNKKGKLIQNANFVAYI